MKKYLPLIILIILTLFAVWPLLKEGFVPTHDGEYHLIRFWQFDKNIRDAKFFPRWAPDLDNGFGVPLFSFFYPLPNYAAEIFHIFGFNLIDSLKFSLALAFFLSGLFFYLGLKEKFNSWPALVGAVFYLYAPYHFLDLYVRGSVGEVWALVWLPAVLWAWGKKQLVLASVFFAFLILSHNILALVFSVFLLSYMLVCGHTSDCQLHSGRVHANTPGASLVLGLGLSAYFWLPALVEKKFVRGLEIIDYADHFPDFFQLIFPSWGTGFSVSGIMDGMSFQIGLAHWLVVLISLLLLWKQRKYSRQILFFLSWFFLLCFLMLENSLFVWQVLPLMHYLQYPWRLLALIIVITSFLAGWLAQRLRRPVLILLLILIVLGFNWRYSRPIIYPARTDDFYLDNPDWTQGTATLANSFNTIWAKEHQSFAERLESQENGRLRVNINYYPGWSVFGGDGQKKEIKLEPDGAFSVLSDKDNHQINVRFTETPFRLFANGISIVSFLVLVLLIFKKE